MATLSFFATHPDVAERETRSLTIQGHLTLPDDEYAFLEFYCDDPTCDCRRVTIRVISRKTEGQQTFATISYGWGSLSHYLKRSGNRALAAQQTGTILDPINPQSPHAPALLEFFNRMLADTAYEARLRQHYDLVKQTAQSHMAHSQTVRCESQARATFHARPRPRQKRR